MYTEYKFREIELKAKLKFIASSMEMNAKY